ncbi:MAG: PAS domain S-box protein, partial [Oscillospiraceae bacterium]
MTDTSKTQKVMNCRVTVTMKITKNGMKLSNIHFSFAGKSNNESDFVPPNFLEQRLKEERDDAYEQADKKARQLQAVIDSLPGAVSVFKVSPEGQGFTYISDVWEKLTGYNVKDYIKAAKEGQVRGIPQEEIAEYSAKVNASMDKKETFEMIFNMKKADGGKVVLNYRATPYTFGNDVLYYGYSHDVTKRMEDSQKLEKTKDLLEAAMDHVDLYYWEYNPSTDVAYAGFRLIKEMGLPKVIPNYPQYMVDNGFIDVDSAKDFLEMHKELQEGSKYVERDILMNMPWGAKAWKKIKCTNMFDENGKAYNSIGTGESFDDYKELEERFMTAATQTGLATWTLDIKHRTIELGKNAKLVYGD